MHGLLSLYRFKLFYACQLKSDHFITFHASLMYNVPALNLIVGPSLIASNMS